MHRQLPTLPRHKGASGRRVVCAMCQGSIFSTLRARDYLCWLAPCTVWQRTAAVLDPNKSTFLHLEKLPNVSFNLASLRLSANNVSRTRQGIYGTESILGLWYYRWFHRRIPRGTIGGFTQGCREGSKISSHWQYTSLTLMCTFEKVRNNKLLSSLVSASCTLADSELITSTTEMISV